MEAYGEEAEEAMTDRPGYISIEELSKYENQWDRMVAKSEKLLEVLDKSIARSGNPEKLIFMRDRVAMRMEHFKRKAKEEKEKKQKI